ncbi:Dimethylallyl tryptophan synthase [Aspergillus sp. HF37]|nr:Dimethylallyl tryptophan synthase [Aspergillus sp. HF37]
MSPSVEVIESNSPGHLNGSNGVSSKAKNAQKSADGDTVRDGHSLPSLAPYDVLSTALPLPNPTLSTGFWWREAGPLMDALLSKANYPPHAHYKYLLLFHVHIVPLLGPRPLLENSTQVSPAMAPWRSFLTDDYSPFEPSWNVNGNAHSHSTVRLGVEPIGFDAGTVTDPFNQTAVTQFMHSRAAVEMGAELGLFEHFRADLFVPHGLSSAVKNLLPDGEHATQSFMAFDFDECRVTAKAYFFPILKALLTGRSTTSVISDAVLRLAYECETWGHQAIAALSILEAWLAGLDGAAKAEMLSVDCVHNAESRVKIYVRVPHTALRKVKEAYCLGGRLNGENTAEGMKLLDELWRTVFLVNDEDAELPQNNHRTAGTIFNFELRPGKWFPEPKVYLPVRHYCDNDMQIGE